LAKFGDAGNTFDATPRDLGKIFEGEHGIVFRYAIESGNSIEDKPWE
jgi:hypothetical protein